MSKLQIDTQLAKTFYCNLLFIFINLNLTALFPNPYYLTCQTKYNEYAMEDIPRMYLNFITFVL